MKQIKHKKKLLILAIVVFVILLIIASVVKLHSVFSPKVFSESSLSLSDVQGRKDLFFMIDSDLDADLPDNAKNLYFAIRSGVWSYTYIAFCLESREQCEDFLNRQGFPLSEMKKGDISSAKWGKTNNSPHTWAKRYQDENWPLLYEKDFFYKRTEFGSYAIYSPESHRIYLHDDPAP